MSIRLSRRSVAALLVSLALGLPAAASAAGFRPLPVNRTAQAEPTAPRAATSVPVAGHGTVKAKDAPDTPPTDTTTTPPTPPAVKTGPGGAGMMIDPNG